jgi:hypothetical protein
MRRSLVRTLPMIPGRRGLASVRLQVTLATRLRLVRSMSAPLRRRIPWSPIPAMLRRIAGGWVASRQASWQVA